jgi:hypothetical protein
MHNMIQSSTSLYPTASNDLTVYKALGALISKLPVPLLLGTPMTIFAAGLVKSSCSPYSVASARNLAVVSNDALRRGDGLWPISVLLNARYAPA